MPVRTRVTRVTVRETEIEKAFTTGDVAKEMRKTALYNLALAQKLAPKRTGNLAATISYAVRPAFSAFTTMYTLEAHAPYAEYTLRDTGPRIWSSRPGGALLVRPIPFSRYNEPTLRRSVAGYQSRDWLGASTQGTFKARGLN